MRFSNSSNSACSEYRKLTRRQLLSGFRRGPSAAAPPRPASGKRMQSVPQIVLGGSPGTRDVMIHVFLRGGMDGLSTCVPYGDQELYQARPDLAVPPPGQPGGAVDLDGFFGLHPSAASLMDPYQAGDLAIVHAAGSPDPTRSHFDAFRFMELGIPEQPLDSLDSGWLARHLSTVPPTGSGLLRGIALSDIMPKTLRDAPATLPISEPENFDLSGPPGTYGDRINTIYDIYESGKEPLRTAALDTFSTIQLLGSIDFGGYRPENGAVYNPTPFGDAARRTAALIKADVGVECAMLEIGGWDTHSAQETYAGGYMARLIEELTSTIANLYLDMQSWRDRLVIVVMSEFGRRVAQNASLGTDHGHGNCMMVLGGSVSGGQVITQWPGLAPGSLNQGDLEITIDYRDILAEILEKRLDNDSLSTVFPNYTPSFQGIIT